MTLDLLDETSAVLLRRQNPNAPVRDDGLRYWGHPTRRGATVTKLVVHTAEIAPDLDPPDLTGERVASYFTITATPSSYHVVTDTDTPVLCLPADHTAFGAVGHNRTGFQISFATRAALWGRLSDRTIDRYIAVSAPVAAAALDHFGIPTRRLSDRDALDTTKVGIVGHYQTDPSRRSDPGPTFPWSTYLREIDRHRGDRSMTDHSHPDPDVVLYGAGPEIDLLRRLGVYTQNTPNAGQANTSNLAIYLFGLLTALVGDDVEKRVGFLATMIDGLDELDPPSNAGFAKILVDEHRRLRSEGGAVTAAEVRAIVTEATAMLRAQVEANAGVIASHVEESDAHGESDVDLDELAYHVAERLTIVARPGLTIVNRPGD